MVRIVVAAAVAVLACSCSSAPAEKRVECHPVRGVLFYKGKPAAGARVVLSPVDDNLAKALPMKPNGLVGPDGTYAVSTYADGDGAPAGDYKVVFTWKKPDPDSHEAESGIDVLPPEYDDPALSRHAFTVKPGPNEIPKIDLR